MSSFFRSPGEVTDTQDQAYDSESKDLDEGNKDNGDTGIPPSSRPSPQPLQKIRTLDATMSDASDGLSRDITRELSDVNRAESSEWLVRVLLEEKSVNDALADYEKQNRSGTPYSKEHPDVRKLADAKYKYMAEMLGKLQVLSPERSDSKALAIKQQARQGLEMLSSQSPGPGRPGIDHRDISFSSINSRMRDLVLASSNYAKTSTAYYDPSGLMGLPSLLQPLVDHPMFELSRYLRDFSEVALIGKGGYGRVYHVQHRLDGSDYAIKKINLNQNRVTRIQERGQVELDALLNELRMLAKFDHPNIVRYYGGWLEYSSSSVIASAVPTGRLMLAAPSDFSDANASTEHSDDLRNPVNTKTVPDHTKNNSFDIMFERSGGEVLGDLDDLYEEDDLLAELQPQIKTMKRRRESESTTTSTKSKLSSVHSVGPDDNDVAVEQALQLMQTSNSSEPPTVSDLELLGQKPEMDSVLTLHIQMSLHPLSLMEYLAAGPMSNALQTELPHMQHCFHLRPSLEILLTMLNGVEYLHEECGLVHRDLKPSNVFLTFKSSRTPGCLDLSKCRDCQQNGFTRSGFLGVRIGDFGLVTEIARVESQNAITTRIVGTELYRPLKPSSKHDEKLDVYAIGIIAMEMLLPFSTRMERHEKLQQVRSCDFSDTLLTSRFGESGIKLAALIRDITCDDEQARLNCSQLRERLEEFLATGYFGRNKYD